MSLMWTITPWSQVFAGFDSEAPRMEVQMEGLLMEVTLLGDGRARIERLLSPQPRDYLRPECQPGVVIALPWRPE